MHKPPVKSVKDLPDNFEFDDPILKACVDIAADYAKMLKNINYQLLIFSNLSNHIFK